MYNQGYRPPQAPVPPAGHPKQKGRRATTQRRRRLWPLWLIAILLIGGAVGVASTISAKNAEYQKLVAEVEAVQNVFLNNVFVDDIHLGGMTPEQGLNAVNAKLAARQNSWSLQITYQGHVFITLNYATLGITSDPQEAYNLVKAAFELGKQGTLEEKKQVMDSLEETPYKVYTSQSAMTDTVLNDILAQIQPMFVSAPTDAYLAYFTPDQEDPFIIQGESYGMSLDIDAVKAQILKMAANGESGALELQPQMLAPNITTADVRNQVTLLHEAITPVSSASTQERTTNIRVAFSKINGLVLEPGKKFSFNNVVGARTLENGFKYAIEYVNGMEEPGIGGGVCQASTTVYLAALQSGLNIKDRTAHSDPVSYTTFGQDATVYYTRDRKIDLVFENNSPSKIYITAHVEEIKKNTYQCVVRIYGPSMGNVSFGLRTQQVETLMAPLTVKYQEDKNQTYVTYKDEEPYLLREAREGFIAETYLQRFENGVLVAETLVSRDTCKAREAVYLTGTKNR
ncbi:MAG: hypothetical protein E7329_07080 [Clostridiales bacterium]|nr:hypothetical protein [Clostridiales bacterium]